MAVVTGALATDQLIGTDGADVLTPMGTTTTGDVETLIGLNGADIYDLQRNATAAVYDFIIDDQGTDGAVDALVNVGALFHSASYGYSGYATAERIGDDLIIHTPSKPYRFRSPAKPDYDIRIQDQYGDGHIETMQAGGVTYNLVAGSDGTASEDFMAGSALADSFFSGDGDDWLFGNRGKDLLKSGAGDDVVFGGRARDDIFGGAGDDTIFGDQGNDRINGGTGFDRIEGGDGKDVIRGGGANDWIMGGNGNDRLFGGAGQDTVTGDFGDDFLVGGKAGDLYRFSTLSADGGWGHDVIIDRGNKASYKNVDVIDISGLYGPGSAGLGEALDRMQFSRDGDVMVLSVDDGQSEVRVEKMFDADVNKYFIENLVLQAGYWTPITFQILNGDVSAIGDDRDYANGGYGGAANEVLFGNDDDNLIFGDAGSNFIWTGAGQDTLIYKENDNASWSSYGGGASHDIVEDFDLLHDRLDFSEIKSVGSTANLVLGQNADGDATIAWNSGDYEVSSILIELRGVALSDVTADLFIFA